MEMKKPAVAFISCFLIFTISGITCKEDNECIVVGSPCKKDGDCCFEKCSFVWTSLGSYCISNADSFIDKIKNIFTVKDQPGMCAYFDAPNEMVSREMYNKYGLNAAHPLLSPNTKVEVTYNNKEVLVTINDRPANTSHNSILDLSKEAARVLDIEKEGLVPCSIKVSIIDNSIFLKIMKSLIPYMGLILLLGLI